MVALNSRRSKAPFLTYLTVFKSRLGAINSVLQLTGFARQPLASLIRRLTDELRNKICVDPGTPEGQRMLQYLQDKHLIGGRVRQSSRYEGLRLENDGQWKILDAEGRPLREVAVYQTDSWLAEEGIASTIGVPTPENAEEIVELSCQLGLLAKATTTWTSAGQATAGLRGLSKQQSNPMRLGLESTVLLRQVLENDGLIVREFLDVICALPDPRFRRDEIAAKLVTIAGRALQAAKRRLLTPAALVEGRDFVRMLEKTTTKRGKGEKTSVGVLEHRTSPRLEWLTDFGALSKLGMPKNAFEYQRTNDAQVLVRSMGEIPEGSLWADNVTLAYWHSSEAWSALRASSPSFAEPRSALLEGYRLVRRAIGPSSIRDVTFIASLLLGKPVPGVETLVEELIAWAGRERGITLSGGRYTRSPELVHISTTLAD